MPRIAYITRDIERALGQRPGPDYYVVANSTLYSEKIRTKFPDNILLIKADKPLSTYELLLNSTVQEFIAKKSDCILVFKNTDQIDNLAKEKGWNLLNPSAKLSEKIENKITQAEWLDLNGNKFLPKHSISLAKELQWNEVPFILQWAHGHTGEGTFLIKSEKEIEIIKKDFPERPARISEYIKGPSFTVNVVIGLGKILMGNISYQITGLLPFTEKTFSTVGNDWSLTHTLLSESDISEVENMVEKIGTALKKEKWLGLFGIDFIRDEERNRICLIEINARQPASATFESELQAINRNNGIPGETIFEAHLSAITKSSVERPLIPINDGAQIIQRVTKFIDVYKERVAALEKQGYDIIPYSNTAPNSDLFRIHSRLGIMESHNKFNARGKFISNILSADEIMEDNNS